jgi:hypothetical protein
VIVLIAVTSSLLSVLLAVAVNVATGGILPGPLHAVSWLAWPAVGQLGGIGMWLAVWQQRLAEADVPPGRDENLTAVDHIIEGGCQVLVLVGPPGVGKSTLALHVAHGRRDRFADGQLFAVLRGADADPVPPEAVLTRFVGALDVPDDERRGGVDDLAARFRSAVADRRLLILLDDARDAGQVHPLLPDGAGCLVLVTSRRLIADLPGAVIHPLRGLDETDGRVLLADAAGAERVAADPEGAARIVRLCGGLPLAVRIAGSRLRARPAWTVAVRLSFATSYRELSTVDRLVFRRAGSHPGRVFAVGATAALTGMPEQAVSATLGRLVDAHLVEAPAPSRYRLHDLLRLFAAERLTVDEPPEDHDACLTRLLDWYTRHAEGGDWLTRERDNMVVAVHRAVKAGACESAWALVYAVNPGAWSPATISSASRCGTTGGRSRRSGTPGCSTT